MSGVVVDSSVAIAWLMPDEQQDFTRATQENKAFLDCVAPPLIWFEIRNILALNVRRKRLTEEARREAIELLDALSIRLSELPDAEMCFSLAARHNLTFYDASYLAVALAESAPLATLDKALAAAAKCEGVEVLA